VKRFDSLQFLDLQTVGRTPWTGDQPAEHRINEYRHPCLE
jgi:hypothetical protein